MKQKIVTLISVILFISCNKETILTFNEVSTIYDDNALIEINIPKAEGESDLSRSINTTIESHIASMLNFSENESDTIKLDDAVHLFDSAYKSFKNDFEETSLVWEAIFDGEVIYQSAEVICVAINGYMNTGGAHGNMNITLYNFEGQTGKILEIDDIIKDKQAFTEFVKPYFIEEINAKNNEVITDYFFDEGFNLPANIGINDEGILMLYNVYEIGSYAQGITEFTIPFEAVEKYLTVQ